MEFNLKTGITYTSTQKVTVKDTASQYGSGLVEVFATPAMVALMENSAYKAVLPYLGEEHGTVGFELNIKHLKATPVGMEVKSTAELIKVEGKKLTFKLEAFDEEAKIGEGTHIRYIIHTQKFMDKLKK